MVTMEEITLDDAWTVQRIASEMGLTRDAVAKAVRSATFPEPLPQRIGRSRVWHGPAVRHWYSPEERASRRSQAASAPRPGAVRPGSDLTAVQRAALVEAANAGVRRKAGETEWYGRGGLAVRSKTVGALVRRGLLRLSGPAGEDVWVAVPTVDGDRVAEHLSPGQRCPVDV